MLLRRAGALESPVESAPSDGLADLVPQETAAAFAASVLGPLRHDAELLDTLRTWLAHHGSWDRSAAVLGVHRNSVRHRIGKVGRLLDVDLADPETRMRLWFALRWLSRP